MRLKTIGSIAPALSILLITILACNLGVAGPPAQPPASPIPPTAPAPPSLTAAVVSEDSTAPSATPTTTVVHQMKPADLAVAGQIVYDVESEGTAPEQRAPYGDSYDINRLERPFLQNMTYIPNLDVSTYMVGSDKDWYYISITIVGGDPNDQLGINYGVELDKDHDGFGDFIVWAHPPYTATWDTLPVQIFQDTNHDTGGLSAERSDAPLTGDGYDKLIFNGGPGDADPDMAWVRVNSGMQGLIQFAFKRSWSGSVFMLGVIADAGLKNPKMLDYVDRFTLVEAGSPIRDNRNYPLKALYAVDNVCREAFGFKPNGFEPQLCPREPQPTHKPRATSPPGATPVSCQPVGCTCGYDPDTCECYIC